MKQLLFIYAVLFFCFAHAQQVNYSLGDVLFNPAQSSSNDNFGAFSVLDVQSKIASGSRELNLYTQYNWKKFNSVGGIEVSKNQFSSFQSNTIKLLYSYKVDLDTSSFFSFGLRSGVVMAKLSNTLIFEDQLSVLDATIKDTQEELVKGSQNAFVTDVGLMLKKNKLTIGLAALNLVKPKWNFSTAEVSEPTTINSFVGYSFVMNQSETFSLKPILLASYSKLSTKVGVNSKVEFSGYEGFEGKAYGGAEYMYSQGDSPISTWQLYIGYSQNRLSFQYGYGNVLSYAEQLGTSNYLMLNYSF